MAFKNEIQPDILQVNKTIRLKKYDGHYEKALAGYQDPYVYQNSEGIFDDSKKPDLNYVKGMFEYLYDAGELYFIEVLECGDYITIGDVTIKEVNPPIAIWYAKYRGKGIGTAVMKAVIARLKDLGVEKITASSVYKWNEVSLKMHRGLGFTIIEETEEEYFLELFLSDRKHCNS